MYVNNIFDVKQDVACHLSKNIHGADFLDRRHTEEGCLRSGKGGCASPARTWIRHAVKGKSPGSANRRGIIKSRQNEYRQCTNRANGRSTDAGRHPRVSLVHSCEGTKQHAKPGTVSNRVAAYWVKASSIVEPCGRVFHRVEQSPESKECQHLQPGPCGPARSQGTCRH